MDFYMIKSFMFILCIIGDADSPPKRKPGQGFTISLKFKVGECVKNLRKTYNIAGKNADLHYMDLPRTAFLTKTKYSIFTYNGAQAFFYFTIKQINPDSTRSPNQFCNLTGVIYVDCINELHDIFDFKDNNSALEVIKWLYINKTEMDIIEELKKSRNQAAYGEEYYYHILRNLDVYNSDKLFFVANFCNYFINYGDPSGRSAESHNIQYNVGESSGGNLPPKENALSGPTLEPYGNYSPSSINMIDGGQSSGGKSLSGRNESATPTFYTSDYPQPNITYYGRQDSEHYSQPSGTNIPFTLLSSTPSGYSQTSTLLMRGKGSEENLQSSNKIKPSMHSAFKPFVSSRTHENYNYRAESSREYLPPTPVIPHASTFIPYEYSKSVFNNDDYDPLRYVHPNQSISATPTSGNSQSSSTGQGRGGKIPSSSDTSYPGRFTPYKPPK